MNIMKALIIIISSILLLGGCRAFNESSDQPKIDENSWQLLAIGQRPADLGDKAFITFDAKESKIAGKAGCNSIFAEYELTANTRLRFSGIGATKMYCEGLMDQENQILTNLEKVRRFEIKYGLLYLYGDELLLTFKKK
jgi:heat shock protein HslJ